VIGGLFILSLVMVMLNQITSSVLDNTKANLTATYETAVANAAQAYIKANYGAVASVATSTAPALITIQSLINTGYLQSGFSSKNPYSQNTCVLVLQPTSNQLQGIVASEGGVTIDDVMLGSISSTMGAAGGGIYSSASTTIKGAAGGWSVAVTNFNNPNNAGTNCSGTPGNVSLTSGHPVYALWFSNGDIASSFLYRNQVSGNPSLNTMNTPLIMGSVQTVGAACTTSGSIAVNTQGLVLSCQSGTWQQQSNSYWLAPVANFASLPSTDRAGSVRLAADVNRVFVWSGTAWLALGVDQNGDFTNPDRLSTGHMALTDAAATSGASCTGYGTGTVARDSSGNIFVCK
jgi:hypothetical protein